MLLVNDFFFEIMTDPLMSLFNYSDSKVFRADADPIELFGTAGILFFIGLARKMNVLKSNFWLISLRCEPNFNYYDLLHDCSEHCATAVLQI